MNERIKDIIGQNCVGEYYAGILCWRFSESQLEKFAELIVRECAELFVDRKYMVLNPLEPFADERVRALKAHDRDTVKTIKQHFGVEE